MWGGGGGSSTAACHFPQPADAQFLKRVPDAHVLREPVELKCDSFASSLVLGGDQ